MSAVDVVRRYLELVETFTTDRAAWDAVIAPDFEVTVYPNRLAPKTHVRDAAHAWQGLAQGRAMLAEQRFEITRAIEAAPFVTVEAVWTGTMAIDAGALRRGQALRASVCMVFELEDGRIRAQRNYDCYDTF